MLFRRLARRRRLGSSAGTCTTANDLRARALPGPAGDHPASRRRNRHRPIDVRDRPLRRRQRARHLADARQAGPPRKPAAPASASCMVASSRRIPRRGQVSPGGPPSSSIRRPRPTQEDHSNEASSKCRDPETGEIADAVNPTDETSQHPSGLDLRHYQAGAGAAGAHPPAAALGLDASDRPALPERLQQEAGR